MVNLGVAEALQDGPKTALELAAAAGPGTNAEWLARVLKMAAELGLVRVQRGLKIDRETSCNVKYALIQKFNQCFHIAMGVESQKQ